MWSKIADNFNAVEKPSFKVTQRSLRDRYSHMEKNTRLKSHTKNEQVGFAHKNLKLIRRWKKIIQLFEDHDRDNEKLSDQKKTKAEEDVTKAEENEKAISGDLQGNSTKEGE